MLRSVKRFSPLVSFTLFSKTFEYDFDTINKPPPNTPKTGWERVKKMYSKGEHEEISIELQNVGQSTMMGAFVGVFIGGFIGSKNAYMDFMENNQATIFKSTFEAKRKLQDQVTIAFARHATRWGWRLAIFSGLYSLTATTLSMYRGDTSLVDFITGGAVAGGIYKINLGLAATFVGAGLGAVLGAIFGSVILIILKVTGLTINELRNATLALRKEREDILNQAIDKASEIRHDQLTDHHDALVAQKGKQKIEDIV